jgi:uncharacterized protein YfaS (alpha-2-macroglobulin family)
MRLQKATTLMIALFAIFHVFAQNTNYPTQWKEIEALSKKGLYDQALKQTKSLFATAQNEKNTVQMVKALIHQFNYRQQFEEDAVVKSIQELEPVKEQVSGVERALLDAALSDLYLFYYKNQQWEINQRQEISGTRPADMAFWTKEHFKSQIESLQEESLSYEKTLKSTSSEYWQEIFVKDSPGFEVFPSLYDFVAWKAIGFYASSEFSNQAKEDVLVLNHPSLFGDYQEFLSIDFSTFDATFYKIKTLQLYQKLIKTHAGRKTPTPLLFLESKRLAYLQQNGQIDQKEELITQALLTEFNQYKGQKGSEYLASELVKNYTSSDNENKLKKAVSLCEEMIEQNIEAKYFKTKLNDLLREELRLEIKGSILPNQAAFAKLSFKNIEKAWFKIVRLDDDFNTEELNSYDADFEELLEQQVVGQFELKVAKNKRLIERSGLIDLPALGYGRYAVIVSSGESFDEEKEHLTASLFWVSNIQLISNGNFGEYLVVDRNSGQPMEKAKVEVYSRQWEYSSRSNIQRLEETLYTDKEGKFHVEAGRSNAVYFHISKGADQWESPNDYIRDYNTKINSREIHHFYTDRAIYRPGQTVYFKGIFTEKTANEVRTLPNQASEIKLYSANGKLLQSLDLISNEFGSVSGSFTLPLSGLNGNYRISDKKGSLNFKVEEYKRPKFEVKIQKPGKEYQLNETIEIEGEASFFAGTGVQNAHVKYKVSRSVYRPWRYAYWLHMEDLVIAAGETTTDEDGKYGLSFDAIAPKMKDFNPWYTYQINVEVTDETGETHAQSLDIKLGNTSLMLSSNLPKVMDMENPMEVKVSAETPNGQKQYPEVSFKLEKLKVPEQLKEQIEYTFDTLLITSDQQKQSLADYEFMKPIPEVEAIVFERKLQTQIDSIIPKSIFKSLAIGKYKMTLSALDKNGKQVVDTAEFQVFSSAKNKLAEPQEFFSYINKTNFEVGDTLQISFGSSFKKPDYYYQLSRGGKILESFWMTKTKELNHINIPVKEEYRGGFAVQVFMVKNNQFYQIGGSINVPYSNKKLDVQLSTFRSVLEPGSQERWILTLKDQKGNVEATEVLAGMYDASLDAFVEHSWSFWPYSQYNQPFLWSTLNTMPQYLYERRMYSDYGNLDIPKTLELDWMFYGNNLMREVYGMYDKSMVRGARADVMTVENAAPAMSYDVAIEDDVENKAVAEPELKEAEPISVSPRKNLQETAFFYPQLTTDKDGNVELNFTSPEALTRWKLMVLAHTKDMKIGQLTQEVTTQKELMVMPNLPRFLRGGDEIAISTKVLNLLEEAQPIKARLEILDAATKEPLSLFAEGQVNEQELSLQAQGQAEVNWMIQVPEKIGAVIIRITAQGDQHSDGEEHILPVLSQLHFLTETYPFTLSTQNTINARDLQLREEERTTDDELTLEVVSNPLWYVVQAIPNYQPPQKADALNWMNYFYIQSMAAHIVKENPEIEEVFKQWQMFSPEELQSELFQNPELKKVMIEETPWLLNAENQSRRKQEIARLFDENNLNMQLETALNKLAEMQKPNGGFGWMDGMKTSPWISAQIASSLGQLLEAGILDLDKDYTSRNIIKNLVKYIDDELEMAYQKALKNPEKNHKSQSNLLSARSYFFEIQALKKDDQAFDFFLNKWKDLKYLKSLSEKMRLARVLWKSDEREEAKELMAAIKDIALTDEHGGIYWRDFQRFESVGSQAEMIALFDLTEQENKWQEGMKLWLLQQKRANDWGNGTSTSRACLAMLADAPQLSESPKVYLTLNGEETLIDGNAGTGYFKTTWKGQEIDAALENLQIRKEGTGMIFGAFYDQYFEKMSEIETHAGGVKIQKQIFVAKTLGDQQQLLPLNEGATIQLGDRILIRMTLENKQAMDFVHLRGYLPAGFENKNPLSGYRWQGAVSYYQSPGDVATDYYLQHLPKGKFVIEYELNATISGKLNSGPAEIQSLYAPEFGGHSQGEMVGVIK